MFATSEVDGLYGLIHTKSQEKLKWHDRFTTEDFQ